MRPFTWRFFRVWQRNRDVFFRLWRTEGPASIIEPVILLLAFGLGMGAYIGMVNGQRYIEFIAPGVIASYAMFSSVFECTYATYIRMEHQYTFDAILATPLNVEDVTAGEVFWGATRAMMTGTLILAVAAVFGLVPSPWAVLVPAVALLEGIMFAAISVFFTSIVPSIYSFNYYFNLAISPMFFLAGVFFPLDSFPVIVQRLSLVAPLTPAVNLNRALFQGEFHIGLLVSVAIIVGYTAVFFPISLATMRRRLTK
jgi:lipooligosaccharide transport system permease protein